jgi:hypothetical protein
MKSDLADKAVNRNENKRDGAAVRQRVIAYLGRADELEASGARPNGSVDRRHPRPCVLLLRGALDAGASRDAVSAGATHPSRSVC